MRAFALAVLVLAQTDRTAEDAVRTASLAFEYRDFERVVALLDPLLHPTLTIADDTLTITARNLLGVSRHVLGDVPRAKEEFSQILLLEPDYTLDAFKIPPDVIITFESVRTEMKPRLDKIRAERKRIRGGAGVGPEDPAQDEGPILFDSRFVMLAPLGIPQFLMDQSELGIFFLTLQAAGLAANIGGYTLANHELRDSSSYKTARSVQYIGLGTMMLGYVASVVAGQFSYADHRTAVLTAEPAGEDGAVITFQLSF